MPETQARVHFSKWHISTKLVIWQGDAAGILHINSPKQLDYRAISTQSRGLRLACLVSQGSINQPFPLHPHGTFCDMNLMDQKAL